jgi:hypothetical protein
MYVGVRPVEEGWIEVRLAMVAHSGMVAYAEGESWNFEAFSFVTFCIS